MKVGITLPQAGHLATRENVVRMAQNAEKEGFDSLWVFERLLWPINPQDQPHLQIYLGGFTQIHIQEL